MSDELDDYTKCLVVGGKTTPLLLNESELTDLFDNRAFKNLRRQACSHISTLLERMSDPEVPVDRMRALQGEFRALKWLIRSKESLIREFQLKKDYERNPGESAKNEARLTQLLDSKETE